MNIIQRIIHFLNSLTVLSFLCCIFIIQTLLHVKYLDLPPVGFHQWRQTQTLAVAKNFYEESMDIFHPRVDSRGQYTGITGMEFPFVNYSIAIGYKLFGFSNFVQRVVLLLFSFMALTGCFLFTRKLLNLQWIACASTIFLMFSPLFCYYSIVALPDLPSLSLIFLSLYFFLLYQESHKNFSLILMLVMLTLSALIKIYALVVLPFIIYHIFKSGRTNISKLSVILILCLTIVIVSIWYLYARYLSMTYHNFDFRLNSNFPYELAVIPKVLKKVFVQWLPELYLNYAEFTFFCVGVYVVVKGRYKNAKRFVLLYLSLFVLYFVTFLPMFEIHDYYAIPALPMLIVLTTVGFIHLVNQSEFKRWVRNFTLIMIFIMPILGSIRSLSRFEGAERPWDLMTIEQHLNKVVPDNQSLIIAAGDNSPSTYLYFMHRKGWPVADKLEEDQLIEMKNNGAKYLVSSSRELESKENILKHLNIISEYGSFKIFALKN